MDKAYTIKNLRFENDYLLLEVDNQIIRVKISDISDKLAHASEKERNDYRISPSGYGIHWKHLDEDLSVNGLLIAHKNQAR
jgi:hypothetical protein